MIDLEFVERLIRALDQSSLDSLEVEQEGTRVRLSKSPSGSGSGIPVPAANPVVVPHSAPVGTSSLQSAGVEGAGGSTTDAGGGEGAAQDRLIKVTSPMVGTFYRAPSPDSPPYAEVGARVGRGTVLCIIEAMKLMNELESEVEGTVAKVLVENAQPVEYGQVLFLIDPS